MLINIQCIHTTFRCELMNSNESKVIIIRLCDESEISCFVRICVMKIQGWTENLSKIRMDYNNTYNHYLNQNYLWSEKYRITIFLQNVYQKSHLEATIHISFQFQGWNIAFLTVFLENNIFFKIIEICFRKMNWIFHFMSLRKSKIPCTPNFVEIGICLAQIKLIFFLRLVNR